MASGPSFTGYQRAKKTRFSVRAGDVLSRFFITVGGIGTIIAVSTVAAFLLWVAFPLLKPALIGEQQVVRAPLRTEKPLRIAMDEYQLSGWALYGDGELVSFRLDTGEVMERRRLFEQSTITASSFSLAKGGLRVLLGFGDGSAAFGSIVFHTRFIDAQDAPDELSGLEPGQCRRLEDSLVERISPTQFRVQQLAVDFDEPMSVVAGTSEGAAGVTSAAGLADSDRSAAPGHTAEGLEPAVEAPIPVLLVDHLDNDGDRVFAAFTADGSLGIHRQRARENILTGEVTHSTTSTPLPYEPLAGQGQPKFLRLSGLGDSVMLAWDDGQLVRFNTRDFSSPSIGERVDLLEDGTLRLTALEYLLGRTTLLAGDSSGRVRAWFPANVETGGRADGLENRLVPAHAFPGGGSAVACIGSSQRMRAMCVGYGDGSLDLIHVTSHKLLGRLQEVAGDEPVQAVAFAPKDDGLMALTRGGILRWEVDPRHPESSFRALFTRVWYEGAAEPQHVWQSSSATDDFEPKFGMMPLIFGTLKATLFSLLLGVPIALFAAIFTSEFLNPTVRSRVKPAVELMASLPSVVLGFLAALVFAPIVADRLVMILVSFVTIPISFLTGARIWQLLPHQSALRHYRWRFPSMFLGLPLGGFMAWLLAPAVERFCFAGDVMRWLDGQIGGPTGGWFALFFPLASLGAAWGISKFLGDFVRELTWDWSRIRCAVFDVAKFLAVGLTAFLLALAAAWLISALGFDPRGGIIDTYVQRNALVVGFVMGFAIIPIIYTISEDALSAVPEHLRSASLGAGATPWQTATRVIVPTAMSGLFSAVMIGLGRAVGETMIVLMAAGNTPLMEWNVFNGFRTLSANIAVELPEAVRGSTHYRTLFLTALVLFAMTFVLNTVAEIIRMRFRKKAFEL
jgi:phosphate transport system permease protein